MTQIMFETFHTPAFYTAANAVLALYATGRTTGVVFSSGHEASHIVPIHEGSLVPRTGSHVDGAGRDLVDYLMRLLGEKERGYTFRAPVELETCRDIKEKLCYVALDFEQEIMDYHRDYRPPSPSVVPPIVGYDTPEERPMLAEKTYTPKSYELPDGRVLVLGDERFRTGEAIINPYMLGPSIPGMYVTLFNNLMRCNVDIREEMAANIVLVSMALITDNLDELYSQGSIDWW